MEWTVTALCVVQDGVCGVDSNCPVCCTGWCVWSGQCALCVVQDSVCGVDSVPCVLSRTMCVEWMVTALCIVHGVFGVDSNGPVCCTGQCVCSGQ